MFVFVGNEEKWDSLIQDAGHQALSDRYYAKRLVLSKLTEDDYVKLVQKVADLIQIAYDESSAITDAEAQEIVQQAVDHHGGVSELSPRRLILDHNGGTANRTLVDVLESRYL